MLCRIIQTIHSPTCFANVCTVLHVLLTFPFYVGRRQRNLSSQPQSHVVSQVQRKGELMLLKLADFGLACNFKKGQFERVSFILYRQHSRHLKTFSIAVPLYIVWRGRGNEQLATPAHALTCKACKAARSTSKTVQKLCKICLLSTLFSNVLQIAGRPLKEMLGTPCYVAPEDGRN